MNQELGRCAIIIDVINQNQIIINQKQKKMKQQISQKDKERGMPVLSLFRFADSLDLILMLLGFIGSLAVGATDAVSNVLFGSIVNTMSFKREEIPDMLINLIPFFIYITISHLLGAFLLYFGWTVTSERQAEKCRKIYFQSLLKKPLLYLKTHSNNQLVESFNWNCQRLEKAIGYNLGLVIMSTFSSCFRIIFILIMGWQLALVCISSLPIIILIMFLLVRSARKNSAQKISLYQKANSRSQQALFGVKTVKSYVAQAYELRTYKDNLSTVDRAAVFRYLESSLFTSGLYLIIGGIVIIGLLYGSILVANGVSMPFGIHQVYEIGYVMAIVSMFGFGALSFIRILPAYTTFSEGLIAIKQILSIIQTQQVQQQVQQSVQSSVQSSSQSSSQSSAQNGSEIAGNSLKISKGVIQFKGVSFSYDQVGQKMLFNNLHARLQNQQITLIGESGNGKSTILQLILKLQTPQQGKITVDGISIDCLQSEYLRESIAYFSQSIFIFNGTIAQNLLFANPYATQQQIKYSLEMACFYQQVNHFPGRLNFIVGHNGEKLSGGQRQRLSLARIFIKDKQKTRIYLLDDPISALDAQNAKEVLNNIKNHCEGKKIILTTHNSRAIKNISFIMELGKDGKLSEFDSLDGYIRSTRHVQSSKQNLNAQKSLETDSQDSVLNESLQKIQQLHQNRNQESIISLICGLYSLTEGIRVYLVIFWIACLIVALCTPLFGYQFGKMMGYGTNLQQLDTQHIKSMGLVLMLILGTFFVAKTIQFLMINIFEHNFTNKLRQKYYQKVLSMSIQWFQKAQNNPSQIVNFLSSEIISVASVLISISVIFSEILVSLLLACGFSIWIQWHIALITMISIPILIIFNSLSAKVLQYTQNSFQQCRKNSYQFLGECLRGIKVITAHNAVDFMINRNEKLQVPTSKVLFNGILVGLSFALTKIAQSWAHMILYCSAVYLYSIKDTISQQKAIQPIFCLEFSLVFGMYSLYFLKDISRSFKLAKQFSFLLKQKGDYQEDQQNNIIQMNQRLQGAVQFIDVSFQYSSRKMQVLSNANFEVKPRQSVFFIGPSGVGKSTIFSLLLGFYKPQSGKILIDNKDIQEYDLHFLRKQFGLVSQQPTLFKGSMLQNIKYNSQLSDQEILDFFMKMNVHEQLSLQNEQKDKQQMLRVLSKEVGSKGSNLSQGEKQIIAVYRQLIKGSQVLLLDQITASLDQRNAEKIYQLINQIKKDRTIICISHKKEQTRGGSSVFQFSNQKINRIK